MSDERDQQRGEHPTSPDRRDNAVEPRADTGLDGLRERLDELHDHVELLGSQGVWPEAGPPAAHPRPPAGEVSPPPAYEQPPPPPPARRPAAATEPPPPPPPDPTPAQQSAATEPPPVATNGHSKDPAEVSARSTSVALVDAGPFADLVELRRFEDDLASLTAVRDVRVRRFGQGRASIEVGLTGPYALSRELYRLGREMSVTDGATGDLVVDFVPPPLAGEREPGDEPDQPLAEIAEEDSGG